MLAITVTAESSVSPELVLGLAGTDFSAQREKIWPNVTSRRLEIHERGPTCVEVTEGGTAIARFFWERSRYDWSQDGVVRQTVLDSNVLEPGSTWQLRAAPRPGGGSTVEMSLERSFRRSFAGRIARAVNRAAGRHGFAWLLRGVLRAVEREADAAGRSTVVAAA